MTETLIKGFMLGMSTGPACMAACFPVLLPVVIGGLEVVRPKSSSWYSWRIVGNFLCGRAMAYTSIGVLIGLLGNRLGEAGYMLALGASVLTSLLMIAYGLGAKVLHLKTCGMAIRFAGKSHLPVLLGFLTGFNMCPPLLLAMSVCLGAEQNAFSGALFFLAFFTASSLYMLPAGAARVLSWFGPHAATTGRLAAVLVGVFFLTHSSMRLWPRLAAWMAV